MISQLILELLPGLRTGASSNTIMDLHALADGKLAYAASDPAFGVFDAAGRKILHRSSSIADFWGNPTGLLLSYDGRTVQFGFEYKGKRTARFSIDERTLTLLSADSSRATDLKPPRTQALGLNISGWKNTRHPKLNGKRWNPMGVYLAASLSLRTDIISCSGHKGIYTISTMRAASLGASLHRAAMPWASISPVMGSWRSLHLPMARCIWRGMASS
jgi:hypothetical protein